MKNFCLVVLMVFAVAAAVFAEDSEKKPAPPKKTEEAAKSKAAEPLGYFQPTETDSAGAVAVEGQRVEYRAAAGTLVVHPKGWEDVPTKPGSEEREKEEKNPSAEASMFYVAYFKKDAKPENRPVMFIYNGGPGSSTVWLHMGAFGPRRVVTADDTHTPAAPYRIVENDWSLLDASDLVFIDAPGTGFSRVAGKDKEKAFWGIDQDAHAFAEFISAFLSKYGRWNSPKYLFGESYGTTRSAVLVDQLQNEYSIDINGVVLLSQILNFDLSVDGPESNPSVDLPYVLALPTYAATAWYHHKLPGTARPLEPLLAEVESFATGEYSQALAAGLGLDPQRRDEVARKLADYTGLPVAYIKKANLRIDGGEFEKNLKDESDTTIGRLDTRFSGPTLDPLSKESSYDPQSSAISSAYVSAFNDYAREILHYKPAGNFKPLAGLWRKWDFKHQPPNADMSLSQTANVMPDLADAMKQNPDLKVLLNAGYFDLATPFYEGVYEMRHLQIPESLFRNISLKFYQSGHMVYAHEPSLKDLHDNVAAFVRATEHKEK